MGFNGDLPSGYVKIAIENDQLYPFILVSFPIKTCDFPWLCQNTGGYTLLPTPHARRGEPKEWLGASLSHPISLAGYDKSNTNMGSIWASPTSPGGERAAHTQNTQLFHTQSALIYQ